MRLFSCLAAACACMGAFAAVELGENIVANGKFENEQSDVPGFWHRDSWNHPENLTIDPSRMDTSTILRIGL